MPPLAYGIPRLIFYLGTHQPHWLGDRRFAAVPLFVSRRTLTRRKTLPRAVCDWALDSGGFTELQMFGKWTVSADLYASDVRRFSDRIGRLKFAAPRDWMCEPQVIGGLVKRRPEKRCPICPDSALRTGSLDARERPTTTCDTCGYLVIGAPPKIHVAKWRAWAVAAGPGMAAAVAAADELGLDAVILFHGTGLDVAEHQRRTVADFLELRTIAPDLPIIPVLQGWTLADYLRHVDMYEAAGVRLREEPTVGVGSVCRRQGSAGAAAIMRALARLGLRLHGFGFKQRGIELCSDVMSSSDSLAWSFAARNSPPIAGHDKPGEGRVKGHKNCANCPDYALRWRGMVTESRRERRDRERGQTSLFGLFERVRDICEPAAASTPAFVDDAP